MKYEGSSYGPGGIIMELTDFSTNYPDFNCAGCSLNDEILKTSLENGEEVNAINYKLGSEPNTYSFETIIFVINMPNKEGYLDGIEIRAPEKPFTFTSGINTISDSYSWKSSYPGDDPDLNEYSWELIREGVNPFDCGYRTLPAGAVNYDGCREVQSSYTLSRVS